MFGGEEEGGDRAGQGQRLRGSCAQGDSSTPAVGTTQYRALLLEVWFSDQQDGHCLRACKNAGSQALLQIFRIRTCRGFVSTLKVSEALLWSITVLG